MLLGTRLLEVNKPVFDPRELEKFLTDAYYLGSASNYDIFYDNVSRLVQKITEATEYVEQFIK